VPNSIYEDQRLSIEAKAVLIYLLSRPPTWEVRHDQLCRHLRIGRKRLERALTELVDAGYAERDEVQGRDLHNRFMTLNYVVRNVPVTTNEEPAKAKSVAPSARRRKPLRETCSGNKKEIARNDSNNLSPNPFPESVAPPQTSEDQYSPYGLSALKRGLVRVFEDSQPFMAWVRARGGIDSMPPSDEAVIDGVRRRIVWMPTLYPPGRNTSAEVA